MKAAEKNGVSWCKEFVDAEKNGPFYKMNEALSVSNERVLYIKGEKFKDDLRAIKRYREYGPYEDFKVYRAYAKERDEMRAKLFGLIVDGKTKYKPYYMDLVDFYFSSKEDKEKLFNTENEWTDKTSIFENTEKYPEYLRGIEAIENRIVKEMNIKYLPFNEKKLMLEQTRNEYVLKSLLATGMTI